MKAVLYALGVMVTPLHAQLYADVSTTMGDFTLELFYEDSPKTVANFVSLAEGSRKWIDPATGEVKANTPYFDGIIFHRVIDGFMNQVGSPQGTGSDGPGYLFPDEVSNGVLHDEPYLLSSANSGPHTNGSQFFITVAVTGWLDGIHTVFGKVSSGTEVIDAINDVPVVDPASQNFRPIDEVSVVTVTIRRVGPEANAFDVTMQGLPEVAQIGVGIESSESGVNLVSDQPAGTTLEVFKSPNMVTWASESRHLDPASTPLSGYEVGVDQGKEFFRSALVTWPPEANFPSDLTGWSIAISAPSNGAEFVLDFLETPTLTFQGDELYHIDMEASRIGTDGYGSSLLIYTIDPEGGLSLVPLRFRLGSDLPINSSAPSGRMTGTAYTGSPFSLNGSFTMTPLP
ncbi:peptidylprolyl isomerase [Akkermansiaceae bacterium]|nr:peptidylprolyl isomerase [Akkermansiaceae bacterium]MDB4544322.1 peptidylprolyl isomerase [Akkermansiaceae bacterium]